MRKEVEKERKQRKVEARKEVQVSKRMPKRAELSIDGRCAFPFDEVQLQCTSSNLLSMDQNGGICMMEVEMVNAN